MGAATAALSIPLLSVASAIARATGCSPPSVYPLFRWRAYTPGRKQPPSQAAGSGCSVRRPPASRHSCSIFRVSQSTRPVIRPRYRRNAGRRSKPPAAVRPHVHSCDASIWNSRTSRERSWPKCTSGSLRTPSKPSPGTSGGGASSDVHRSAPAGRHGHRGRRAAPVGLHRYGSCRHRPAADPSRRTANQAAPARRGGSAARRHHAAGRLPASRQAPPWLQRTTAGAATRPARTGRPTGPEYSSAPTTPRSRR